MSNVWVLVGCYDYEPSTVLAVFTTERQAIATVDRWKETRSFDKLFCDLDIVEITPDTIDTEKIYI